MFTSVDNLLLQIPFKFQVDRIKTVCSTARRVEEFSFEKNALKSLKSFYLLSKAFDAKGCNLSFVILSVKTVIKFKLYFGKSHLQFGDIYLKFWNLNLQS